MESNEKMSLWDLVEQVADPRNRSGQRHPLQAILRMMISGFLCGCNSTASVLRWAKRLSRAHKEALGLTKGIPTAGALSNLFAKMNVENMEQVLNQDGWVQLEKSPSIMHIAIDGKTIRGSSCGDTPAIHLLSAFAVSLKSTLKQHQQDPEDNEISSALKLFKDVDLKNTVVSGDAIFAQKKYM